MFFKSKKTKVNYDQTIVQESVGGHTLIAPSVVVSGDLRFSGTLRIDGKIDGKVTTSGSSMGSIILSKTGVLNGPVETTSLVVDGVINGNVKVTERLECRENARIHGNVSYGSIHISEGALIEGRCTQKVAKGERSLGLEDVSEIQYSKPADFLNKS